MQVDWYHFLDFNCQSRIFFMTRGALSSLTNAPKPNEQIKRPLKLKGMGRHMPTPRTLEDLSNNVNENVTFRAAFMDSTLARSMTEARDKRVKGTATKAKQPISPVIKRSKSDHSSAAISEGSCSL
jgi:hypothetical protein